MSGVIRATKSGSTLRKYFEGKTTLDWETFTRVLKTHCSVKTAQNLCDQMRDSAQEPTEDTHDYIMDYLKEENEKKSGKTKSLLHVKGIDCFVHIVRSVARKDTSRKCVQITRTIWTWGDMPAEKETPVKTS